MDPLSPIRLTTAYFILFCITVHVLTGVDLIFFPESAGSTTVATPVAIFGSTDLAGLTFLTAASCALFAMRLPYPWNVFALLPQQAMLIMATIGIIEAVYAGHFADGVMRPRMFILQDHCELPMMCLFHGGVIIMRAALSSRLGPGLFYHPLERIKL
jgi:hypothetical protein